MPKNVSGKTSTRIMSEFQRLKIENDDDLDLDFTPVLHLALFPRHYTSFFFKTKFHVLEDFSGAFNWSLVDELKELLYPIFSSSNVTIIHGNLYFHHALLL